MKLLHVVPHINEEAAGPSYTVPRLCESLAMCGNSVELATLAARGKVPGVRLTLHSEWPVLSRFAISSSMAWHMREQADIVDVVHNHSLWSMINVAAGVVVPSRRAKLVVSPRGTLSNWALLRSRNLKRILWPVQRLALERADLLHATSEDECREIRELGFTAPVAIIPNGIDIPIRRVRRPPGPLRTILFLSRIHAKKGIDILLNAWGRLEKLHPSWRLVIAGRGEEAYVAHVRSLANQLQLERVSFPGPLYGAAKSEAYWDAELFVLPTHSENFGMVVAEALAHSCPSIVSTGAPWAGLNSNRCGWWVPNDLEAFTHCIDLALRLPANQLEFMGEAGRAWMTRDYGWRGLAEKMNEAYRWINEDVVERPAWVNCSDEIRK